MVKFLPEFEDFYCILENSNFISEIKKSKVTDYAALTIYIHAQNIIQFNSNKRIYQHLCTWLFQLIDLAYRITI